MCTSRKVHQININYMSRNNSIYSKVVQSKGIKVNVSANGGLSASVCHWSKVNRGVTCGEFRTNIKLFFRKINKEKLSGSPQFLLYLNSIC